MEKKKTCEKLFIYWEYILGIRFTENSPNQNREFDDHDEFFVFSQQTETIETAQEELHRFLKSSN